MFSFSHFCEKARWALEHHNIEFDEKPLAPGMHVITSKKLGVPGTTVPILVTGDQAIQGSSQIISWADARGESEPLTPEGGDHSEIEKRLDDVAGVHVRRFFYSDALFDNTNRVRDIFANEVSLVRSLVVKSSWPVVRNIMIKQMDLGPEQGLQSKSIVDKELDWLDGLLSDGRKYLGGNKFSRVDLTAASLLAPLAIPDEHPKYTELELPEKMATYINELNGRPSMNWVRDIYKQHRRI